MGLKQRDIEVLSYFLRKACVFIILCLMVPHSMANTANPCNEAQFWVIDEDSRSLCIDCEICPPGQGLSHRCGQRISAEEMVICVPCKQGVSFSTGYDTSSCTFCDSPCSEDQVVHQNCTRTHNVKCDEKCYSSNSYYDKNVGCLPCAKCCGDGEDVVEDECKKKLGPASETTCSFNNSVNRCDSTTASPQITTPIITTPTYSSFSPTNTHQNTSISHGHNSRYRLSQGKHSDVWIAVGVSLVVLTGLIVAIATYNYRCFLSRRWSFLTCGNHVDVEMGTELAQYPVKEPGMVQSSKGGTGKKLSKCDQENVKRQLGSSEPILGKDSPQLVCQCQLVEMGTKKVSKPLRSLLEHESNLERICNVLDTSMPVCGDYKVVAEHYGLDYYKVKSVLEKSERGPSRALIESLAATHTDLTVEEFAAVVEKKAKRKDVLKLLREYDVAE